MEDVVNDLDNLNPLLNSKKNIHPIEKKIKELKK